MLLIMYVLLKILCRHWAKVPKSSILQAPTSIFAAARLAKAFHIGLCDRDYVFAYVSLTSSLEAFGW